MREGLRFLGFDNVEGLEIHHQGDLPARSGIGSSSTFAVGMISALTGLRGERLSKHQVALKASNWSKDFEGKRRFAGPDCAAYGGLNVVKFSTDGSFQVEPVAIKPRTHRELEKNLCLLYTGTSRLGGEIAASVIAGMRDKTAELRQMRKLVDQALGILTGGGSLAAFGELLHETWILKRGLADAVSNPEVDEIYKIAREHGALGGKILGAGSKGLHVVLRAAGKTGCAAKGIEPLCLCPVLFRERRQCDDLSGRLGIAADPLNHGSRTEK